VTLKQMRDQVTAWLGLQDITAYDETQLVEDKLYQGTLDLLSRTRCVVRCVELNVTADQDDYILDHGILSLVDVEDGARRRLRRDEQGATIDIGVILGSGPAEQIESVYGFTLIRSDLLRLVPTPSEDGQVQVWAVLRPQQMVDDTDSPGMEQFGAIPDEFHDAIVDYALWKLADYSDDGNTQNGEYYRVLYEGQDGRGGRLAQVRVAVNRRGTARLPRSRVRLSSGAGRESFT
jgi:hypothetical protein